jgi:hypothetical protein
VLYFWTIKGVRPLYNQTVGHSIWGFHSGMNVDFGLLGCYTMYVTLCLLTPTLKRAAAFHQMFISYHMITMCNNPEFCNVYLLSFLALELCWYTCVCFGCLAMLSHFLCVIWWPISQLKHIFNLIAFYNRYVLKMSSVANARCSWKGTERHYHVVDVYIPHWASVFSRFV